MDFENFCEDLSDLCAEINARANSLSKIDLECLVQRTEEAIKTLDYIITEGISDVATVAQIRIDFFAHFQDMSRQLMTSRYNSSLAVYTSCSPTIVQQNCPGRPKLCIEEETLIRLRLLGYNWTEISKMLLVSRWTLHRRVVEFGIHDITGYTVISDDSLDEQLSACLQHHGLLTGRSMATGYLRSRGIYVQRRRVISSLQRVSPRTPRLRWAARIQRRQYSVPGPNSLWHLDGHHSLINWGFVIHGCIDGFSRYIVFLHCSTNNRKETVLSLFDNTIDDLNGFAPSRIRTDKGGENVLVWARMEELRGSNRGSYIAGASVHNQRIERLWVDVWTAICCNFYYTFQAMENQGILNTCDNLHMHILHYIFLPRINVSVKSFVMGWNAHPMRTLNNWSPERSFVNGLVDVRNRHQTQIADWYNSPQEQSIDTNWYGVDFNGPLPTDDDLPNVEVPEIESQLTEQQITALHSINPLQDSSVFGIDLFTDALHHVLNAT